MPDSEYGTFSLILAAAGRSSRFSREGSSDPAVKKTFAHLGGKPVWLRCVEKFASRDDVVQIIIVIAPDDITWFRKYYMSDINRMLLLVVQGGENRVDSIRNALVSVTAKADFVAVHDAARPCVSAQEIAAVFKAAKKAGAALLAAPAVGTIKKVSEDYVEATLPRESLWEAQTPQVFRRELLINAYQQHTKDVPTDDAQLVERLGHPVYIVPADRDNIKITTQADLVLAKYLVEKGR